MTTGRRRARTTRAAVTVSLVSLAPALLAVATVALVDCGKDGSSPPATDAAAESSAPTGPTADAAVGSDATTANDAGAGARDAAPDGSASGDSGQASSGFRHPYALTGLVGTGQSLSVGAFGVPEVSIVQPYHNVRLKDSTSDPGYQDAATFVPLIAPERAVHVDGPDDITYPTNLYGETPYEATSNEISALFLAADGGDAPSLMSAVGETGQVLSVIQKNGTGNSYASAIREATVATGIARALGESFGYTAVFLTHGESDSANPMYEAGIIQLQADYDADLRAATGQANAGPIPLFLSQQGSFPPSSTTNALSTQAEWQASLDRPGLIVCVGPKYQYEYVADDVHMPAPGYVQLGEKYAEAYIETIGKGNRWHPLAPLSVTRSGLDIVVHLDVAYPPLSWDPLLETNHVTKHTAWQNGFGFEVSDSTGELAIQSVAIQGTDVHVTLAAAPTGTALTLAYAMSQDVDVYAAGTLNGRHGALRDSDPFVGRDLETVAVNATQGSATVTAVTSGTLAARALHDRVSGASTSAIDGGSDGGTRDGITVVAHSGDQITLSSNWTGPSGVAMLTFAHEQRNYLVEFTLPVP